MDPLAEVTFESGGQAYRLYFGNRALRLLEREFGVSFLATKPDGTMAFDFDLTSLDGITKLIWAGLQQHHSGLTFDDIDGIVDGMGDNLASAYSLMGEKVTEAIQKAFPAAEEGTAQGNGNRAQRRAKVGTGIES